MHLADNYPDAESKCIQRSIHGVNRTSLGRRESAAVETNLGSTSASTKLRKRSGNLNRNDSQWGHVSAITKATHFVVNMTENNRPSWVANHLKKKECIRYVADQKKPNLCCCGRLPRQHCLDATISPTEQGRSGWDKELDIKEYPTDANGQIFFNEPGLSYKPVKYVRVSNSTDPKVVLEVLTRYWKLQVPKLVIAVTGGKKNFKLNSQDQATFNRGLIKATRTIGVWVMSGGTNVGVTKVVGKAIREARSMSRISKEALPKVALIGLPPWAYTAGTDRLVNDNNEEVRSVTYKVDPVEKRGQACPLNPHHTHFILVDDGRKNKYGGNLIMQAKLQEQIPLPLQEGGLGVPVVSVILEGGVDTIDTALFALRRNTPVIICNGTGRAADILSYATKHSEEKGGIRHLKATSLPILREKIRILFEIPSDDPEVEEIVEKIDQCMADEHLLTVFEMQKGEQTDLDLAILTALLKLQAVNPIHQLSLAQSWNRVELAESKILTDDVSLPTHALHPFVTEALVNNQVDFLRLFIERGVIIKDYLTVARLRRLYNSAPDTCFLRSLIDNVIRRKDGEPIFLHDIGILIKYLTGAHSEPRYMNDRRYQKTNKETRALVVLSTSLTGMNLLHYAQEEYVQSNERKNGITTGAAHLSIVELANPGMHFDHPFRELFIWAVLMDRPEMAVYLWEQVDDPMTSAIAASSMLTSMDETVPQHSFARDDYMINARKFEQLAIGVVDECYHTNDELAEQLISFQQTRWDKSVLEMAAETNDMDFISHHCCQGHIHGIWLGGMTSRELHIIPFFLLFFYLLPFLIPLTINFKDEEKIRKQSFTMLRKLYIFHSAPITKFYRFLMNYVAFLLLYSAFILYYLRPEPSIQELLLFIWISTFVIDEIREATTGNSGHALKQRVKFWFNNHWNKFDIILLLIAMVAFALHYFTPSAYEACRVLFAIDCMLFYVRTLRFFAASTRLGPKMVMIWKMISQMLVFLCILGVFLCGYGVASQALLYPDQDPTWFSIKNTLMVPYFQIYGELYLDAIQHGEIDGCGVEGGDPCPTANVVVIVLLAIYLLVGNVLLLNLLIAIFSRVFEEVQANSLVIWRYEYYFLVIEFKDKPLLPPPFTIFVHLYDIMHLFCRVCMRTCSYTSTEAELAESKKKERNLHLFERECAASYKSKKADEHEDYLEQRLERIEDTLTELGDMMAKHAEHIRDPDQDLASPRNPSPGAVLPLPAPPQLPPSTTTPPTIHNPTLGQGGSGHGSDSGSFVNQMNALNNMHSSRQPPSILKRTSTNPPPPGSGDVGQRMDVSVAQMQAFMNLMQQRPPPPPHSPSYSPASTPRHSPGPASPRDYPDDSQNFVLDHKIVEGHFQPETGVRSPPEGGDVPSGSISSSSRSGKTKSSSKRRKKKKRVAPLDFNGAVPVSRSSSSPRQGHARSPRDDTGSGTFPPWYQRSAFPTIAEQDEKEEEEDEQQ